MRVLQTPFRDKRNNDAVANKTEVMLLLLGGLALLWRSASVSVGRQRSVFKCPVFLAISRPVFYRIAVGAGCRSRLVCYRPLAFPRIHFKRFHLLFLKGDVTTPIILPVVFNGVYTF